MTNPAVWIALGAGILSLAVSAFVFMSFSTVRKRLIILQGKAGQADLMQSNAALAELVTALRAEIKNVTAHIHALTEAFKGAVQHVAVFRYDAFEDMGGKLSFSAAFLDGRGDGVVISCINGRQEARTYAKPVEAAKSAYNLSPEEEEAIRRALTHELGG